MKVDETTPASRQLEITIHFCRTCGIMAEDREAINQHLNMPEHQPCLEQWGGGVGTRKLMMRMVRFTANSGDQELRLTVRPATNLPELVWAEAQIL